MRKDTPAAPASEKDSLAAAEVVIKLLLNGESEATIRQQIGKLGVGDPRDLLIAASEHFARVAKCDLDVVTGWAIEAYREVYRQALLMGELNVALRAVKELRGLVEHVRRFSDDETDAEEIDGSEAAE